MYREIVEQQLDDYSVVESLKEDSKWRHYNSRYINLNIDYPKQVSNVIKTFGIDKSISTPVGVLVCNMLALKREFTLAYSRDRRTLPKTYNKRNISYVKLLKAVDWLVTNGYALEQRGKRGAVAELRFTSYLWPTNKLLSLFNSNIELSLQESYISTSVSVVLKDKTKKEIDYRHTGEVNIMSKVMEEINISNSKHIFADSEGNILDCCSLTRIFTESFKFGGRLYRTDAHQIKHNNTDRASSRLGITIDGLPVVEIDYCNLHATILCAMEDIKPTKYHGDMYTYVLDSYSIPYAEQDRKLIKQAFNIMLNSENSGKAIKAIQSIINSQPIGQDKYTIRSGSVVWNMIYECMPEFHKYFDNPDRIGLKLQRMDSDMAAYICHTFAIDNKPIIPVHDSFIVLDNDGDHLLQTMNKAFKSIVPCARYFPVFMRVESLYFPDEIVIMQ